MHILMILVIMMLAYLLGSIPTAVWTGKIFHNIDIREHGSGNAGATNVIRILGWKTGIPVMIVDIAKGWAAAMLPFFFSISDKVPGELINYQIFAGILAIVGHVYPVFAGFRGGKGVGSTFGVLLALNPLLTLSCLGIFLAVLLISGYVSLSSMSAGVAFPVFLFTVFNTPSTVFKAFSVFIAVSLIITHRKNIRRLIKGEESKFLRKKKKP